MRVRKSILGILAMTIVLTAPMYGRAQITDTSLSNSAPPAPVGSGARAMGYGGAFIAIADDATAASWNPGGLVQLVTPETSLAYTFEHKNVNGDQVDIASINYFSVAYPFHIGPVNMVVAGNYQRLYDFYYNNDFDTKQTRHEVDGVVSISDTDSDGTPGPYFVQLFDKTDFSKIIGTNEIIGDVGAVSPSYAIQITPEFSVGFTYNFWQDGIVGPGYEAKYDHRRRGTFHQIEENYLDDTAPFVTCNGGYTCDDSDANRDDIDNPSALAPTEFLFLGPGQTVDPYVSVYSSKQKISFEGQNFNVGFMLRATPRLTVGGVYRSEFTANLHREFSATRQVLIPAGAPNYIEDSYHEKMTFPASYGLGLAFRYSDEFTVSFDATRIEWDRFIYEYKDGTKVSPVNGMPKDEADIDPTMTYRLGAEYLVIQPKYVIPVRGGVYYDPEPARGTPDDYYGVALGTGIAYDKMILDLTYWYRWGDDVILSTVYDDAAGKVISEDRGDISRQMIMFSAILHLE